MFATENGNSLLGANNSGKGELAYFISNLLATHGCGIVRIQTHDLLMTGRTYQEIYGLIIIVFSIFYFSLIKSSFSSFTWLCQPRGTIFVPPLIWINLSCDSFLCSLMSSYCCWATFEGADDRPGKWRVVFAHCRSVTLLSSMFGA